MSPWDSPDPTRKQSVPEQADSSAQFPAVAAGSASQETTLRKRSSLKVRFQDPEHVRTLAASKSVSNLRLLTTRCTRLTNRAQQCIYPPDNLLRLDGGFSPRVSGDSGARESIAQIEEVLESEARLHRSKALRPSYLPGRSCLE